MSRTEYIHFTSSSIVAGIERGFSLIAKSIKVKHPVCFNAGPERILKKLLSPSKSFERIFFEINLLER